MMHLPSAAVSRSAIRIWHTTLAVGFRLSRAWLTLRRDVSLEAGLQISGRHLRKAPQAAVEPGAKDVHHPHLLQVDRVVYVGPVFPALEPAVPDQCVVLPLEVVDLSAPDAILLPMALLTRAELGFPLPKMTATEFLWTTMATQMQSF